MGYWCKLVQIMAVLCAFTILIATCNNIYSQKLEDATAVTNLVLENGDVDLSGLLQSRQCHTQAILQMR